MPLDRFGLFYEIGVPKPWDRSSEFDMFHRVVEQAELGDRLGYNSFWTVEHHFLPEFSHCSAPETLYPYIAARTQHIRIGHGVRLLPYPYNHPVRAAEQAAMLDLLSDGRLEYGVGRSSCWDEFEGFGIDPGDARPMLDEALEVLVGCWSEEVFSHDGDHFRLPPRQVIPKPRQDPHPPLWLAATGAESHEAAALKGLGLLSLTLATPLDEIKARLDRYKAAIPDARPVGKFVNDRAATFLITHVAETTAEAKRNAEEAAIWYVRTGLEVFSTMLSKLPRFNPASGPGAEPGAEVSGYKYMQELLGELDLSLLSFEYLHQNSMILIGDPDDCIAQLRQYADAGFDEILTMQQFHDMPDDQVRRSMALFAEEVMPAFTGGRP